MDVFDLAAKITLDDSGYKEQLDKDKEVTSGFADKLKSGLGTAAKVGAAAVTAVATASAAMGAAVLKGASETAAYGDNIDKMSQKMGLTAEAYQEWDAVLQHSGSSIEAMQSSMKTLATAVESGNEAFERIGLTQEQLATMSQQDIFEATIAGLQNVEDTTERTYLAGKLLGRGATELGALLNTSAEDTQAMRDRVHELGGVMSDDAVKAAAAYQDSLQDMQTAFKGLSRGLTSSFMPGITTVMDGLTELFSGDSDTGLAMISEGIDSVLDTMTEKLPEFLDAGLGILDSLLSAIVSNLPKLSDAALKIIERLAEGILNNLPAIITSGIQILTKLIVGLTKAIPQLVAMLPEIIKAIVEGLKEAAPELLEAGGELLAKIVDGITKVLSKIVAKGKEIITKLKEGVTAKLSDLLNLGRQVVDNIKSGISEKWHELTAWFGDLWDKLFKNRKVDVEVNANDNTGAQGSHAIGLDYVPTNKYMAELHRGEAVLTATEAEEWRRGKTLAAYDPNVAVIVELLEEIVANGLNANVSGRSLYNAVRKENTTRTRATNYNALAMA